MSRKGGNIMKHSCKKILNSFIVISNSLLLLLLSSCNFLVKDIEPQDAYIKIGSYNSRTALPEFDYSNFSDFTLSGTLEDGEPQLIGTWNNISFANAKIQAGTWNFVLTAKHGSAVFEGVLLNKTINAGENILNFTMEITSYGNKTSYGALSFNLNLPESVKSVKAGLFDIESGKINPEFKVESIELNKQTALYKKGIVPSGAYIIKFFMYSDEDATILLNEYSEVVVIASEAVTKGSKDIAEVNATYKINYELGNGQLKANAICKDSYSILTTVYLPSSDDLEYADHIFAGWYETENFSDTAISSIPAGSTYGDKTFYARWVIQGDFTLAASEVATKIGQLESNGAYTIKATGSCDANTIANIKNALVARNNDIIIYLDLSEVSILTELVDKAFLDCKSLHSIILPSCISKMGSAVFSGCSNLTSITIPFIGSSGTATTQSASTLFGYIFGSTKFDGAVSVSQNSTIYYIPSSLRTVSVLGGNMLAYAFDNCSMLSSIKLPETLSAMGDYSMRNCSGLSSFTIPRNLTEIGQYVFNGCSSITRIEIPANVKNIKNYAFNKLSSLEELIFEQGSLLESIGSYAFDGCTNLLKLDLSGTKTTTIGDYAFRNCSSLSSVNISNNELTDIKSYAFAGCSSISSIVVPPSVIRIGSSAFSGCSGLTEITLPFIGNSVSDVSYRSNAVLFGYIFGSSSYTGGTAVSQTYYSSSSSSSTTTITYYIPSSLSTVIITGASSGKTVQGYAFINCTNVVPNIILKTSSGLEDYAFAGYKGLKTFEFHETSGDLPKYMFYSDTGLTTVKFINPKESFTKLMDNMFNGCTALSDFVIPNTVKTIGQYVFKDCKSLADFVIPTTVEDVSSYAFQNCSGISKLVIPNSIKSIGIAAFGGCSGLNELTIPYVGATSNGEVSTLFGYIFGTTSYTGGTSVTQRTSSSANGTTYYIPSNLSKVILTGNILKDGAFYGCSMINSIDIPESIKIIPPYCFYGCSGLTSSPVKSTVTSIGAYSLYGCSGLESISIPESIQFIEEGSFANCSGLKQFVLPENLIGIKKDAFSGCSSLEQIIIPSKVLTIEAGAFAKCTGLVNMTIPSNVIEIGLGAFSGCTNLAEITLPFIGSKANATTASETTLFGYIFGTSSYTGGTSIAQNYSSAASKTYYIPTSLKKVYITGGNILYGAFYNCTSLEFVLIDDHISDIGTNAFYKVPYIHYHGDVEGIPWGAISYNRNKTNIKIPSTCIVAGTGDLVCDGCDKIIQTDVTLPLRAHVVPEGSNICSVCHNEVTIIPWVNTSNESYRFVKNGTKWTSNNKAVKSSKASSTWTINVDKELEYSFKYKVSSEANYDKLSIEVNGIVVVGNISGQDLPELKCTVTLKPGTNTIKATYVKDSSNDYGTDSAYIILEDLIL